MDETKQEINEILDQFWEENVLALDDEAESVDAPLISVDSMTSVEALVILEDHFNIKLPDDAIKIGGYESKEEFIGALVEATCVALEQKNGMAK